MELMALASAVNQEEQRYVCTFTSKVTDMDNPQ